MAVRRRHFALRRHAALSIDPSARTVLVAHDRAEWAIGYDRLIVATGATPIRPDIPGCDLAGVYLLHTMDNSFAVHRHLDADAVAKAVIVGAGYIGREMAELLGETQSSSRCTSEFSMSLSLASLRPGAPEPAIRRSRSRSSCSRSA